MKSEIVGKYRIESFEKDGKILVKVYNTKAKKEWNQLEKYFSFRTEEERTKYIDGIKSAILHREEQKEQRRLRRINFVNPAKVGDILEASWGYDQTNVDYYQVVGVKGKMVEVREIGAKTVEGSGFSHGMADMVTPAKDRFIKDSEVMRKIVRDDGNNGYYAHIDECRSAYLVKETSKTYRSCYA